MSGRLGRVASFIIAAAGVAGVLMIVAIFPRLLAVYYSYYGEESIERLFFEVTGLDAPLSKLLAVPFAIFYGIAWVFVIGWAGAVLRWKLDPRKLLIALPCFVIVYAMAPAAQLILGTPCFNQRDGTPQKWYVIRQDGKIILYDSPGFDPDTGAEKKPVNAEVCRIASRQRIGELPHKIDDQNALRLFPKVWYASRNNQTDFFDQEGINAKTLEILRPATDAIMEPVRERLERERARAEKERIDQERRQRAEKERLDREQAAQEKAHQIEEERQQQLALVEQQRQEQLAKEQKLAEEQEYQLKRKTLVQQLSTYRVTSNQTDFDCTVAEDGVHFNSDLNPQNRVAAFANARVTVERGNLQTNLLLLSILTPAIVIRVMGPSFEIDKTQQCLMYTINPAPAVTSAEQNASIGNVLDALSGLGFHFVSLNISNDPPFPLQGNGPVSGSYLTQSGYYYAPQLFNGGTVRSGPSFRAGVAGGRR